MLIATARSPCLKIADRSRVDLIIQIRITTTNRIKKGFVSVQNPVINPSIAVITGLSEFHERRRSIRQRKNVRKRGSGMKMLALRISGGNDTHPAAQINPASVVSDFSAILNMRKAEMMLRHI